MAESHSLAASLIVCPTWPGRLASASTHAAPHRILPTAHLDEHAHVHAQAPAQCSSGGSHSGRHRETAELHDIESLRA